LQKLAEAKTLDDLVMLAEGTNDERLRQDLKELDRELKLDREFAANHPTHDSFPTDTDNVVYEESQTQGDIEDYL
jgi:hypothetical protein